MPRTVPASGKTRVMDTTICFDECYTCGIPVAMTPNQYQYFHDTPGKYFYCVLGHQTGHGTGIIERLERELKEAQDEATRAETAFLNSDQMLAVKIGEVRQLTNQAKKGQCAHCEQYFSDVHRHMKNKHPEKVK